MILLVLILLITAALYVLIGDGLILAVIGFAILIEIYLEHYEPNE